MPIPPGQGAVIICNHRSPVDPSFIQLATGQRVVHWMVAKEYCEHPLLAWFFRTARSIPVSRGGIDTAATKLAIRLAEEGELVGLFPEGRINISDELLMPGRPGAALIALKARVPVVPCYCSGAPYRRHHVGRSACPARVRLVIGEPIDLSAYYGREGQREVLEELTLQFLRAIAGLAGSPTFSPAWPAGSTSPNSTAIDVGSDGDKNRRVTARTAGTNRWCRPRCDRRPPRCGRWPLLRIFAR